jgi:Flp pilus assembly protein TadD
MGNVLAARGQVGQAITHFQRAVEIDPGFGPVHNNLGVALADQGRLEEAIAQYRQALKIEPDHAAARVNLGRALAARGQLDEAVACYRKALQTEPASAAAHFNLADALGQQGKFPDAVGQLREAARLAPDNVKVLNRLAWVLATCPDARVRNGAEALALARRAVQLAGRQEPLTQNTLAAAYAEAGRFREAVQTAAQALPLASAQKNNALTADLRARLKLYASGSPCRDNQEDRGRKQQPLP